MLAFRGVSKSIVITCFATLTQLGKKGIVTMGLFTPNCARRASTTYGRILRGYLRPTVLDGR